MTMQTERIELEPDADRAGRARGTVARMKHQLRPGLPPLPESFKRLPVDERGYPVPFFVAMVKGKPDHRVADARKLYRCVREGLCWLCGEPIGRAMFSFTIGPMCSISRVISEPPQHHDCAVFAAIACPFMTRPRAKRRESGLPEERQEPAGEMLRRNPGAVCVWTTASYEAVPTGDSFLFDIGQPAYTEWYAEGRRATRAEVEASVESGLPLLQPADRSMPAADFAAGIAERRADLARLLDAVRWPETTP